MSKITSFVRVDQRDWDKHFQVFSFAVNTVVHSSTGVSPSFLNFGRQPRTVRNIRSYLEGSERLVLFDPMVWQDRAKRLKALHDLATLKIEQFSNIQTRYYNRGKRKGSFDEGELVWRRTYVLSSTAKHFAAKLVPNLGALCRVVKKLSPIVYEVCDEYRGKTTRVDINDLTRYVTPTREIAEGLSVRMRESRLINGVEKVKQGRQGRPPKSREPNHLGKNYRALG